MLDPSTSGHTGGRAEKEPVGLGKKLKCVKLLVVAVGDTGRPENWKRLKCSASLREAGSVHGLQSDRADTNTHRDPSLPPPRVGTHLS